MDDFLNKIKDVIKYAKGIKPDEVEKRPLKINNKSIENKEDRKAILTEAKTLMKKNRFSKGMNLGRQINLVERKMSKFDQSDLMRATTNTMRVKNELRRRARKILRDKEADLNQVKLSRVDAVMLVYAYLRDLNV